MTEQKKRFLVTLSDSLELKTEDVVRFLGVTCIAVDGVPALCAAIAPADDQFLYFDNLKMGVFSSSDEEAENIRKISGVTAVEEDVEVQIQGFFEETPTLDLASGEQPWNISMTKAEQAWERGFRGNQVSLAIVDTGIASHQDLNIQGGVSLVDNVESWDDDQGHGTHCAGIAAATGNGGLSGIAPETLLWAVKVLDDKGRGSMSAVLGGLDWCITNGINVASLSLGAPVAPQIAYTQAISRCHKAGVTVVAASGNSYGSEFGWVNSPANTMEAAPIAVGALDENREIASFSSRGTKDPKWNPVTVAAPGVGIYSTYLNNEFKLSSGTSMACPHVAGLACLVKQAYPEATPDWIKTHIGDCAESLGTAPSSEESCGAGLIDADKATAGKLV